MDMSVMVLALISEANLLFNLAPISASFTCAAGVSFMRQAIEAATRAIPATNSPDFRFMVPSADVRHADGHLDFPLFFANNMERT
jgi:hypothetical protein